MFKEFPVRFSMTPKLSNALDEKHVIFFLFDISIIIQKALITRLFPLFVSLFGMNALHTGWFELMSIDSLQLYAEHMS